LSPCPGSINQVTSESLQSAASFEAAELQEPLGKPPSAISGGSALFYSTSRLQPEGYLPQQLFFNSAKKREPVIMGIHRLALLSRL
jgi:hypothetical protein